MSSRIDWDSFSDSRQIYEFRIVKRRKRAFEVVGLTETNFVRPQRKMEKRPVRRLRSQDDI